MISQERRKIDKIYNKINKLAYNGYKESFYDLLDDLVNKGEYYYFENVMLMKYNVIIKNKVINDIRESMWEEIIKQTNPSVSVKIKKLYDINNVYQIGYNIYDQNGIIGQIEEIYVYPEVSGYYYKNIDLEKQKGFLVTYLKVYKTGISDVTIVGDENYCPNEELLYYNWIQCPIIDTSEDNNLVKRYELAIQYLIS